MDEAQVKGAAAQVKDGLVLEVDGAFVQLDRHGYLIDLSDWSRAVTERMAELDGMELEDDHWLLIDFLHRFYKEFSVAPEMPVLARNLCKDQKDCRWSRRYINQLFPRGAKTACRYAGLPEPAGRSCG
jgi:tRNA 2-thiouridine synthesizing protein E